MPSMSYTKTETTETKVNIEYVHVYGDYHVYLMSKTTTSEDGVKVRNIEGVATLDSIKMSMQTFARPLHLQSEVVLGCPELLEFMRTKGWFGNNFAVKFGELTKSPYTRWNSGGYSAKDLIVLSGGSHNCRDYQGIPLPCAMRIGLSIRQYDLEKATQYLNSNNFPIGYQNDRYVTFEWAPSREDYLKMWRKATSYEMGHQEMYAKRPLEQSFDRAIFDEDLIGLRAFGAAKFDNFFKWDDTDSED